MSHLTLKKDFVHYMLIGPNIHFFFKKTAIFDLQIFFDK